MSDYGAEKVNTWSGWIWRASVLLLLTGQLWISAHFVSKEEFHEVTSKLNEVRDQVLVIRENLKNNEKMDREIAEVKTKLETFEREALVRETRLQQVEKRILK